MPIDQPIVILVPCYNEGSRVETVVHGIRRELPEAAIVVIDDSSGDDSGERARAAGATVLRHPVNLGYGSALETGYLYALRTGAGIVLQMDGDGQHRPDNLPLLLAPVQSGAADLVIGSRYAPGAPYITGVIRRTGHRLFAAVLRLLTGLRLTDPTSGFQCLNRTTLELFTNSGFPCDYPDSDVILMAHMAGLRIREVPVRMEPRTGGTSMHSGLKPIYYGMKMFLSMFIVLLNFRRWASFRARHPQPGAL